jgi:transposase-like protein
MERRKFTREFKLEAVRLIRGRGVSYVQAPQDLGAFATCVSVLLRRSALTALLTLHCPKNYELRALRQMN